MALEVQYEYDPEAQRKATELFRQAAAYALYMNISFGALVDELRPLADHREKVNAAAAAAARQTAAAVQRARKAFGVDGELDGVLTIPVPMPRGCTCDDRRITGPTFTPAKQAKDMGE